MSPLTLETELKRAAAQVDWNHIVHRCAWCKRVADAQGEYVSPRKLVALDDDVVATDGMCPACGARALAVLDARRLARERPAA
ncbi:MAG: hypothetical protein JO057_04605 [Chloroflexi bacterium]|nr:hypothetical protein [Chloroflexota bacterium]